MAEGLARRFRDGAGADVEIWSAGTEARGVHPLAIQAISEVGIDISGQRSKTLAEVPSDLDYVITLCDEAEETCPVFPARTETMHWRLPDPSLAEGSQADRLGVSRKVRDQIRQKLEEFWEKEIRPAEPQ